MDESGDCNNLIYFSKGSEKGTYRSVLIAEKNIYRQESST